MKNKLLLILALLSLNLTAQDNERIQKIARSTCECLNEKNLDDKTPQEVEVQFGLCILGSVSKNKKEFDEMYGGKSIMEIDMEKFGEEIGLQMAMICPDVFMNLDLGPEEEMHAELNVELGKITGIEKKQFNIVNLEMGDGSVLKFLWLWDFEGSDILSKGQYKNKWINIFYSNLMLYDAGKKSYVNYKVIEGVEFGE